MRRSLSAILFLSTAALALGCMPSGPVDAESAYDAGSATPASAASLAGFKRGEYLVTTSGCHDCHTPLAMGPNGPEPDMTRMLSGHPETLVMPPAPTLPEGPWLWVGSATNTAFAGPWGISFAANLTPDPSGVAGWDEESFIRAMRTGKHYGTSRAILPPMPWPAYGRMSDDDLKAILSYLRSVPPINNHVPEPVSPISTHAEARFGDASTHTG